MRCIAIEENGQNVKPETKLNEQCNRAPFNCKHMAMGCYWSNYYVHKSKHPLCKRAFYLHDRLKPHADRHTYVCVCVRYSFMLLCIMFVHKPHWTLTFFKLEANVNELGLKAYIAQQHIQLCCVDATPMIAIRVYTEHDEKRSTCGWGWKIVLVHEWVYLS